MLRSEKFLLLVILFTIFMEREALAVKEDVAPIECSILLASLEDFRKSLRGQSAALPGANQVGRFLEDMIGAKGVVFSSTTSNFGFEYHEPIVAQINLHRLALDAFNAIMVEAYSQADSKHDSVKARTRGLALEFIANLELRLMLSFEDEDILRFITGAFEGPSSFLDNRASMAKLRDLLSFPRANRRQIQQGATAFIESMPTN